MNIKQDLLFALRIIRKNPWFSAAIVVTLALGIGVNATVFSLVNAVLYKPLPFPGGDRLVMVGADNPSRGREFMGMSYPDFRDYRQQTKSFEHLEAYSNEAMSLGERGNPPQRYRGMKLSAGMFEMLRVKPILGRGFVGSDEKAGDEAVVLLGNGLWQERYGKDPGVIGRNVRVNENPALRDRRKIS
ncbi:MAG: ABC transporter permease [Gammaproteobacteria bacterium]